MISLCARAMWSASQLKESALWKTLWSKLVTQAVSLRRLSQIAVNAAHRKLNSLRYNTLMKITGLKNLRGQWAWLLGMRQAPPAFADAPTGLRPPAQRCRFGYVGYGDKEYSQPQRGCALDPQGRLNRVAVEGFNRCSSQGSRGGNPGLEDVAPFGPKARKRV